MKKILLGFLLCTTISCNKSREMPAETPYTYEIHFKFVDQGGNNLLANMVEDDLDDDIKISSLDGKIISSGVYIKLFNGEKLLNVIVNSQRDDFLESIEYSIDNSTLTGLTTNKLIKSTWQHVNNNATVKTVNYNSNEIVPIKHTQSSALAFYPFVRP